LSTIQSISMKRTTTSDLWPQTTEHKKTTTFAD